MGNNITLKIDPFKLQKTKLKYLKIKTIVSERKWAINKVLLYLIPDKVLAVGPNNELFYFKLEH